MLFAKTSKKILTPVSTLLFVWLVYLFVLGILQFTGLKFGFDVWPMGEDRNWLSFMLDTSQTSIAHAFWAMNDRNPLSAWWWMAISPLVKHFDCGLYLVRKCIDPFLAVTVYLLLNQLGRHRCQTFAFSVALLVLLWNFSSYFNQIMWDFLLALGTSLLSIYFYVLYVDSNRSKGDYLAIALILYLLTIATYTLQVGAIIAIACLSLLRTPEISSDFRKRVSHAIFDTGYFAILFIAYYCIWYTVSRNMDVYYVFNWGIFADHFLSSLHQFLYHPSYHVFNQEVLNDFSPWVIAIILFGAFAFFWSIFFIYPANKIIDASERVPLGWVLIILLAIAMPIVMVESTSTIWYPGSRSLMVQQVWQPLLYVFLIFIAVKLLPFISEKVRRKLTLSLVALLGAYAILIGLDYNHRLVIRTHDEKTLAKGIAKLHLPITDNPDYIVKLINPDSDLSSIVPVMIAPYGETMLHQPISLRIISDIPDPAHAPYWRIQLGSDEAGAINVGPIGDLTPVPYKRLWILFYDGKKVWLPNVVTKEDMQGLQVDWNRDNPIKQER